MRRRCWSLIGGPLLGGMFLAVMGCQQQMAEQPAYRPFRPSEFFADGRSARPLVPGTVARGTGAREAEMLSGRVAGLDPARTATVIGLAAREPLQAGVATATPLAPEKEYVTAFPFPISAKELKRGQERYTIFCAVCHDPMGTGHGKIPERGYVQPPSYHTDLSRGFARRGIKLPLRDAPVGYYYEVITEGFGAMPDYSAQVPPRDRWRIVAYIRALQLSQQAPLTDLPAAARQEALKQLGGSR